MNMIVTLYGIGQGLRALRVAIARRLVKGTDYAVRQKERRSDPCAPPHGCMLQAVIDAEPSINYASNPSGPGHDHVERAYLGARGEAKYFRPEDGIRYLHEHPCKTKLFDPEDQP
jgi:hypothetical protein